MLPAHRISSIFLLRTVIRGIDDYSLRVGSIFSTARSFTFNLWVATRSFARWKTLVKELRNTLVATKIIQCVFSRLLHDKITVAAFHGKQFESSSLLLPGNSCTQLRRHASRAAEWGCVDRECLFICRAKQCVSYELVCNIYKMYEGPCIFIFSFEWNL